MIALFREQPRAFHMIFMLELWERFGFYTVQGIITLFFIRQLGFSEESSYYTFGAFTALVYGMTAFGGYLGDSILGTKRTIVLGMVTLALGYFALAMVIALDMATRESVFYAIGLICVGNGIFKANPSNLLGKCYEQNDPRLHGGFTLYYMSINIGSTFSLIIGPTVAASYGYSPAYMLSAIGLVLGLVNYWAQHKHIAHINTLADQNKISIWGWLCVIAGIVLLTMISAQLLSYVDLTKKILWCVVATALCIYFIQMSKEDRKARLKMMVALALMVESVIFFTLYQQMPTSLNLFAVNNVNPNLFFAKIDPQSFQALNPLWIIVMSPVLASLYGRLNKKGIGFSTPYKFAMGMSLCGFSFAMLYFARFMHDESGIVSSWWLIVSYLFQSTGEIMVSALGLAMVAELVPPRITGFVLGLFFLTSAVAGFTGAAVASYTAIPEGIKPGIDSLMIYTSVFAGIGGVTLGISILMWLAAPWLGRYIKHDKNDSLEPNINEQREILNMG